uniref:WAP four-disulfide core domain 2 n=1 Tax=Pygocentrus nattereri TaxID=42514 RepID=A0AAR2JF03_PYGNA
MKPAGSGTLQTLPASPPPGPRSRRLGSSSQQSSAVQLVQGRMKTGLLCFVSLVLLSVAQRPSPAGAAPGRNSTVLKAGHCPRKLTVIPSSRACVCDDDCPGDDKCCVFDCGAVCVPPAFTKPGVCPRRKWGSGMCAEYCTNDSDCPNEEKCCHNGCGHECIAPYTGKTSCPQASVSHESNPD